MKVVTLTTDFGLSDWFVGTMKGVILKISPNTQIVDITHDVPSQDIRAGAFALMCSYKYFPEGSVHVVVVDPGVGTRRGAIAVKTRHYWFVGPDNGVLSYALREQDVMDIRAIENQKICIEGVGTTFHGRDVFAPAAAHIARGINPEFIGRKLRSFVSLPFPEVSKADGRVTGEVLYIDKFGNAITNIRFSSQGEFSGWHAVVGRRKPFPVMNCYADAKDGEALAVYGSSGFIEIALRNDNAAEKLNLKTGTKIQLIKP